MVMQGFPPPPQERVTLDNWQHPPFNRWSFHHVREVVPTARVARGTGLPHQLPSAPAPVAELPVTRTDGSASSREVAFGSARIARASEQIPCHEARRGCGRLR